MSNADTVARRPYDSTLRRARATQTRDRIVDAGAQLVRSAPIRDWRGVTIRAVAELAGVNERTVYRHFPNERALRDAVMHSLERQAGIDLDELAITSIGEFAERIFRHVAMYPLEPRPVLDPTLSATNQRQHDVLLVAVAHAVSDQDVDWSAHEQRLVAGVFDVLWGVTAYERLVHDWQLDSDDAIRAITWVLKLVQEAVESGSRP